jgi:phosphate transport system permease protein
MESIFKKFSLLSATLILLLLTSIFVVLFIYAKPAIDEFGLKFLTDPRWGVIVKVDTPKVDTKDVKTEKATKTNENLDDVNAQLGLDDSDDVDGLLSSDEDDESSVNTKEVYGGLVPIVGTILSTILAMIFAVPLAMGIAIFLSEIAPPFFSKLVGIAIELLAAIPSIIYGIWGLFYFGPLVSEYVGGQSVSLLVAGLVLGVMIIPFIASLTRDSMNTTPAVLKESAYAMGATKFEVIKDVIFPYAKQGIIGSIILALGRALGETMAVAFVIGGVFTFPKLLTDPTVSIPVVLANSFAESSGMSMAALFYLAVVLFIFSFAVISFAKFYFLRDKK